MAGKPQPLFYVAVGVAVVALIGFAIYRSDLFAPRAPTPTQPNIDPGCGGKWRPLSFS